MIADLQQGKGERMGLIQALVSGHVAAPGDGRAPRNIADPGCAGGCAEASGRWRDARREALRWGKGAIFNHR